MPKTAAKFNILMLNMFLEEMLGLPLETGSDFSQGKQRAQMDVDHLLFRFNMYVYIKR